MCDTETARIDAANDAEHPSEDEDAREDDEKEKTDEDDSDEDYGTAVPQVETY